MAQQGRLRLLVVDDIAATRENVKKLLSFERDLDVVGMAQDGQEAVDMARETQPHVILMDINMPVMDGIEAVKIICEEMPNVHVVMMSVQRDRPYLRRAMQAGARAYLTKPFTYDDLSHILDQVRSLQPRPGAMPAVRAPVAAVAAPTKLASLVVVFSPRGGAGCSTVALNIAFILRSQRKKSVLLMDGNLRFGALDAMLNLQTSRSITDTLAALGDDDPELIHNATLPHTSGLRLLAAPPSPEMADMVTTQHLEQIIALGRRRYDYVVADLGSHLDDNALLFMDTATRIIILLTPDSPAIKNARLFLEIAQGLDYDPEKIILALNQADSQETINASAIERHLKHPVSISIPSYPRTARAAINRGVPLSLYER
ncbi:MAG: response regulator, partial [Gammaproteobacteria bacterium]